MSQFKNRILNALPQNIFAAVEPHLKRIDLPFGMVVAETNRPVEHVYFPESGIISLVVEMTVGDMIETAMLGREGVGQWYVGPEDPPNSSVGGDPCSNPQPLVADVNLFGVG